jgi:hypothetical protein
MFQHLFFFFFNVFTRNFCHYTNTHYLICREKLLNSVFQKIIDCFKSFRSSPNFFVCSKGFLRSFCRSKGFRIRKKVEKHCSNLTHSISYNCKTMRYNLIKLSYSLLKLQQNKKTSN